ncbi:hypothetical protein M9H77_02280 [Catharanthus roseus]|uniref:Uncharacterized protein n=1 Tax=Catharanthus roseus TaxID=4058 RepID=A0ACC0C7W9_CATRO|nr:hypothetical protein M9H77_02280 [Catharanthus roseus]
MSTSEVDACSQILRGIWFRNCEVIRGFATALFQLFGSSRKRHSEEDIQKEHSERDLEDSSFRQSSQRLFPEALQQKFSSNHQVFFAFFIRRSEERFKGSVVRDQALKPSFIIRVHPIRDKALKTSIHKVHPTRHQASKPLSTKSKFIQLFNIKLQSLRVQTQSLFDSISRFQAIKFTMEVCPIRDQAFKPLIHSQSSSIQQQASNCRVYNQSSLDLR